MHSSQIKSSIFCYYSQQEIFSIPEIMRMPVVYVMIGSLWALKKCGYSFEVFVAAVMFVPKCNVCVIKPLHTI